MEQRHNIILFGAENTGKTSTLMALAALLGGIDFSHNDWDKKKRRLKCKGNLLLDTHFVIHYKDRLVFIATAGDNWNCCRVNYDFFTGQIASNMKMYEVSSKGVSEIEEKDKGKYRKQPKDKNEIVVVPNICISACRPEGDRRGAIKSIHSYSEDVLDKFDRQIWIRIESNKQNSDMNCWEQAKKLISIIDDLLKL